MGFNSGFKGLMSMKQFQVVLARRTRIVTGVDKELKNVRQLLNNNTNKA
jgi:hypothetical protein